MSNSVIPIPYEFEPSQPGGSVTKAKYIVDGDKTQEDINKEKINDVDAPEEDGLYVRKNGHWSKLTIVYDEEHESLVIDF